MTTDRDRCAVKAERYRITGEWLDVRQTNVLYKCLKHMRKRLLPLLVLAAAAGAAVYAYQRIRPEPLVLTGIVTTNDVIVGPQISGQIAQLLVNDGDTVKKDQLVAVISPDELKADTTYFSQNVAGLSSQVRESEAALRVQERQVGGQIPQGGATPAAVRAPGGGAAGGLEAGPAA